MSGTPPRGSPLATSPPTTRWRESGALASSPGGGLRPASRGSAKPAPTTRGALASSPGGGLRPASRGSAKPAPRPVERPPTGIASAKPERPVERWTPTGIARERETRTNDPWSAGQLSRWGPPTGIARERETRTNDPIRNDSPLGTYPSRTRWRGSAGLRPASRGSAKPAPTTRGALASSPGLRPASRGSAKPAPTTPEMTPLATRPLKDPMARPERRSPTGIARERETRTDDTVRNDSPRDTSPQGPDGAGAPASDRHRAGARNECRRHRPRATLSATATFLSRPARANRPTRSPDSLRPAQLGAYITLPTTPSVFPAPSARRPRPRGPEPRSPRPRRE